MRRNSFLRIVALLLLAAALTSTLWLTGCGKENRRGDAYQYENGSGRYADEEEPSVKANKFFVSSYIRFIGERKVELYRGGVLRSYELKQEGNTYTEEGGLFSLEIEEEHLIITFREGEGYRAKFNADKSGGYLLAGRSYVAKGKLKVTAASDGVSDGELKAIQSRLEAAYKDATVSFSSAVSFALQANELFSDDYSISFFGCIVNGNLMTQSTSVLINGTIRTVNAKLTVEGYDGVTLTLEGLADGASVTIDFEAND